MSSLRVQFLTALFMRAVFYCPDKLDSFAGGIASRLVGGRNDPHSSFSRQPLFVRLALSCRPSKVRVPIGHRLQGETNKASQEEGNAKTQTHHTTHPPIPCVGCGQGL
jgi:hypothetical protein